MFSLKHTGKMIIWMLHPPEGLCRASVTTENQ